MWNKFRLWVAWVLLKAAAAAYPYSFKPASTAGSLYPSGYRFIFRAPGCPSTVTLAAANLSEEINRRLVDEVFEETEDEQGEE